MSRTVAIMQPYLFPYLGYLQLMQAVDTFVLFDTAQFIRRGWINRNRILLNGQPHTFTVPVTKCPRDTLIQDVRWGEDVSFRKKLLQTMTLAYAEAPYSDAVLPWVEKTLFATETSVSKRIEQHFVDLYQYLGLEVNFFRASTRRWRPATGASERILAMCSDLQATRYINPINGQSLYDSADFIHQGVELEFLHMQPIEYLQLGTDFVSHLSIIDVLMMNAPSEVLKLLQAYQRIQPT